MTFERFVEILRENHVIGWNQYDNILRQIEYDAKKEEEQHNTIMKELEHE